MLCCCERAEQTASRIMYDYNIDLGEWGVSSVSSFMAKIVDRRWPCFEDEPTEWSNLQYKVTNQLDPSDKL